MSGRSLDLSFLAVTLFYIYIYIVPGNWRGKERLEIAEH